MTSIWKLEELVYRESERVPHNPPHGQDFVLQMIHSGAIQQTSVGGFFESPIPSYARWLKHGHHRMPPLSSPKAPSADSGWRCRMALNGDMASIAHQISHVRRRRHP